MRAGVVSILLSLSLLACTPVGGPVDGGPADGGPADDGPADGGAGHDAGSGELVEQEPNDGATLEEVNELPLGASLVGNIDVDDADIFRVPTVGGRAYRVSLEVPAGSALAGHLTVLDSGRGDDAAGSDYVRLSRTGVAADVELDLVAMGDGHLVVVRDARNVGGAGAGGGGHGYVVRVEELDAGAAELAIPSTLQGSLAHAGALRAYRFDAASGMELTADLSSDGDLDARLFVVSLATGDWIARADDRSATDTDPLLDAPLFGEGEMLLVVENIAEEATSLGYTLAVSSP